MIKTNVTSENVEILSFQTYDEFLLVTPVSQTKSTKGRITFSIMVHNTDWCTSTGTGTGTRQTVATFLFEIKIHLSSKQRQSHNRSEGDYDITGNCENHINDVQPI